MLYGRMQVVCQQTEVHKALLAVRIGRRSAGKYFQDLRKNHLNTGILELLNEVIVQQTALDPVDRLPAVVG
jgi:hypothetical protein